MKIMIKSDGTSYGTRIYDADSDQEIKTVTRVVIDISQTGATALLTLADVPLELLAEIDEANVIRELPMRPDVYSQAVLVATNVLIEEAIKAAAILDHTALYRHDARKLLMAAYSVRFARGEEDKG